MPRLATTLFSVVLVTLASVGCRAARPRSADLGDHRKKLIHWGNHTTINRHLLEDHHHMQRMPFDGGVFHMPGEMEKRVFSAEPIAAAEVDPLIATMKQMNFTRFTDNFLAVVMFMFGGRLKTPPLTWEDDKGWETVCSNMRQVARLAKEGGFQGILLDNEHYSPSHLDPGGRDPDIGELRGRQVMEAMRSQFPDMKILVTMGHVAQTQNTWYGYCPTSPNVSSGFLDGLLMASAREYEYIEGLGAGQAYSTHRADGTPGSPGKPAAPGAIGSGTGDPGSPGFRQWRDIARNAGSDHVWSAFLASRRHDLLRERGRVAFGLYENGNEMLVEAITNALAHTDEYVWIYADYPHGFWRDDSKLGRNYPSTTSVPMAEKIAAARGAKYAVPPLVPKPVSPP